MGESKGGNVNMQLDRYLRLLSKHRQSPALAWVGFLLLSLVVWKLVSDGDFSFIMTYGAFARTFGFGLLAVKLWTARSATGVSFKTLQLYALVFFFRLTSIIPFSGYLPYDKSGDWFYHFVESLSLFLVLVSMYLVKVRFPHSYDERTDSFGNLHVPASFGALVYLAVPCFALAVLFHPGLNSHFLADTTWAFSMYLESVAMLPQLYMFQKQSSQVVEVLIGHWVFASGFARVLDMIFWMSSYHELVDHSGSKMVGVFVLLTQFIHIILMVDFFYYYLISVRSGLPLQLPRAGGLV
ncbi:hypothetical protein NSK_003716 [Nannochloropsis salina CCMP1776]|uniref:ER lumen protein-retaining receptor n=1 Tax=Nannochloropsis salina CCMP1776 TaxID=1027361 RepID=A0A4D9D5N8_9STRA|nr:hypothetical protein NSK_003716 [Nannochloropsis salina CCMP1776]|eukprot:TFJ85293.1 hypothetical protein NSK_003716 [Nannochloropsis salina CCMP1776]